MIIQSSDAITVTQHERHGVLNHRHLQCLLIHLSRVYKMSKIPVTGPPWGEFTADPWILSQGANNAKNVSMLWRHHDICRKLGPMLLGDAYMRWTTGSTFNIWGNAMLPIRCQAISHTNIYCLNQCWLITSWAPHNDQQILPLFTSWWRHQFRTFSALLALCVGNSPVNSPQKASDAELWCFLWSAFELMAE